MALVMALWTTEQVKRRIEKKKKQGKNSHLMLYDDWECIFPTVFIIALLLVLSTLYEEHMCYVHTYFYVIIYTDYVHLLQLYLVYTCNILLYFFG